MHEGSIKSYHMLSQVHLQQDRRYDPRVVWFDEYALSCIHSRTT